MDTWYGNLLLFLSISGNLLFGLCSEASVVGTAQVVQGWKGEDIRLSCIFQEQPLGVYWVKENISDPNQVTNKAIFYDGAITFKDERFDIDSNFSLVITDLKVADEGRYLCQVALSNLKDYSISTTLAVYSMASRHEIEECVNTNKVNSRRCTYNIPKKTSVVTLTCVVSGFKPNITMEWMEKSGKRLHSVVSQQVTIPDGTFERFEAITVSVKQETEVTFICRANGDSVNGTLTREITVLRDSGTPLLLFIGIAVGVSVALVILFLLFVKVCGVKCKRKRLRRMIKKYRPGSAAYKFGSLRGNIPSKVNINLFGEMSAGKSCLINSLRFALTGKYETVAEEGHESHGAGKTRNRFHLKLTENIDLIDTRGVPDFSDRHMERLQQECNGERGLDPLTRVKRNEEEECHCAVFVHHDRPSAGNNAKNFIRKFCKMVNENLNTNAVIVITHKRECANPKAVRQDMVDFTGITGEKRIWMFENYTGANHVGSPKKDVKYLEFLWSALQICDHTIYHRQMKSRELKEEEPGWGRRILNLFGF
ncbi:uncharacterized protein [Diadema antillarum]|uniref:uncharacterized protein n=1 Tax=Diadema antillarum TaxID=105358 RepID=UPI003A8C6BD3